MFSISSPASGQDRIDVPDTLPQLAQFIVERVGCDRVHFESCNRLPGGAIQENWLLSATVSDGARNSKRRWVLRTDSPSSVAASMSRAQEFAVLREVYLAGVKVPEPLWFGSDHRIIGRDFFIMQALDGTASGHRLTNDKYVQAHRVELCHDLGRNLALLHRVSPEQSGLSFLHSPHIDSVKASIDLYRQYLDALPGQHLVLEWGLRWCELNRPTPFPARLIHRDYRTGNYMVHQGRLVGVLDWEFAGWGDPREDLGWFTARCWRFGCHSQVAGGVGALDDFLDGYQFVSGYRPSNEELRYWQVMAHLRWAVIALQQAQRHLTGQQRSLELALTGRLVPELEFEVLALIGGSQ